ncbi:unnamed protein product [Spirodela intermedia]|uniref:Mediator complex subunit Med12 domain-containing protein n=1 Tax=Spirodela intermedia TaxID=51605 RepID=A0A7I8KCP4_SPIIN|nr:unnamed protein product [Spirodela intermedia]
MVCSYVRGCVSEGFSGSRVLRNMAGLMQLCIWVHKVETIPFSQSRINVWRPLQLAPYKLKCEKEPLSGRIGPPDFHPQTPNCPEETLTREYLQTGYKDTVEGIEEAREITLSQVGNISKSVVQKCKEALKKRLKAINESRAQKRKAGQVYGVPLSGQLLTKPGIYPEQRPYGEESRKKWIEGLSQPHKRLRSLADHVPHGFKRNALLDVLIRHNVPLLRATWFVKVNILNQNKSDKTHSNRTEQWTKIVIENLKCLLDDFLSKDGAFSAAQSREQSSQTLLSGLPQNRSEAISLLSDGEESLAQYNWWYMVRMLQWHFAEGLLYAAPIIEWVFTQLQEKDSLQALELLLPVVVNVIEKVALSQHYVGSFFDIAVRAIKALNSGGTDLPSNARKTHLSSALCEMLRYLMLSVPDTFVAIDAFPLPTCIVPDIFNSRNSFLKIPEGSDRVHYDSRDAYHRYLSFGHVVSSLRQRVANLSKVAIPNLEGHGVAKVIEALDKSLLLGDVKGAHSCLFEELSDVIIEERWIGEVSSCLWSSLKWIGTVSMPTICAVFFICEWATCDYRDFRTALPRDVKFTGRKDLSQVYFAVSLLKLRMQDMYKQSLQKRSGLMTSNGTKADLSDVIQSPGPLHDIIVCWLDQHEVGKGEGFKSLQIFIVELINCGIFYPHAYVRQLIVSGIMDGDESTFKQNRQRNHYRILKQLPGSYLLDVLKEAKVDVSVLHEAVYIYTNERRLLLQGFSHSNSYPLKSGNDCASSFSSEKIKNHLPGTKDDDSPSVLEFCKNDTIASTSLYTKLTKAKDPVAELKNAVMALLRIPSSSSNDTQNDELRWKRSIASLSNKVDGVDGTPSSEECRRAKMQKLSDEKGSPLPGFSSHSCDDEDCWWVRKGSKSIETSKVEATHKSTKHASRGRRKTQSLAQLAAARIEGSQGASTSHVCESKVSCTSHKSVSDGDMSRPSEGMRTSHLRDIGKALKQLRLLEKKSVIIWLLTLIKLLIEGNEKSSVKPNNGSGPFSPPIDERTAVRWKLGEDEFSSVLYLFDISYDWLSSVKFLLWLLPRVLGVSFSSIHAGRNMIIPPKNKDNQVIDIGEVFFLSALQRYENVLVAAELLPEALTAAMQRAASVITSNGRSSCPTVFTYVRKLLKRYGEVPSVAVWEKNFRTTCDPRVLAELEAGRSSDVDIGYSLGLPSGLEDLDEYVRQKMSGNGRISRTGLGMKEILQRHIDEALLFSYGRESKNFAANNSKSANLEKWDDDSYVAQQIVSGLLDCIRQNGGAAPEGDPFLVSSAVSAIVSNVGPAIVNCNYQNLSLPEGALSCVQRIVRIHISCLCLLKEALGDRVGRIFDVTIAAESSSIVSGALSAGKFPRSQFQPSPETHDVSPNNSSDVLNAKVFGGRAVKAAAAVSALVIGALIHGVSSLERMITVFRLKEGLDVQQFIKSSRSSSNGMSRSNKAFRLDHSVETYVHWFRVLVGNSWTLFDGLVGEIIGESYILCFSRMQRMVPLTLTFPPAYSIFALVVWRPYILGNNVATREEIQLFQCLTLAIDDAIRHHPFRDLCFRDTRVLYDLLASDSGDSEFAAMFDFHGQDKHFKTRAFVPLRARLFLNAMIDCRLPPFTVMRDDGTWVSGHADQRSFDSETKLLDELVHVLDTLQPAKFHWQWVMVRLLLNEQALIEKIETLGMPLAEAIRSLYPNTENSTPSENESSFTEIVLTRLLVRPDAASLYSDVLRMLGRSLEDKLLLLVKWFLGGNDILLGRKSIRQRLVNFALPKGVSTKVQFCKPWGWSNPVIDTSPNKADKRKVEMSTLEEGEVVDEVMDIRRQGRLNSCQTSDAGSLNSSQQFITEKALAELVLPCIDRSSSDARDTFASELIKQMCLLDQHINSLVYSVKQGSSIQSGVENSSGKSSNRKGIQGGSPGMGRRPSGNMDSAPPSSSALRASMWLRLQFILRSVPIIYTDRDPTVRTMRHTLASVLLHMLGTRVVYEDADIAFSPATRMAKRQAELTTEPILVTSVDCSGDSLFDMFLYVFHGLLSGCKPSWLKLNSSSKSLTKPARDFSVVDRDFAEKLQAELDHMHLPLNIRKRIQAAMPVLPSSPPLSVSCHPPTLSSTLLAAFQASTSATPPGSQSTNPSTVSQRAPSSSSGRLPISATSRNKPLPAQEPDSEIDPWTLLEDGTGSSSTSANGADTSGTGGDPSNLKACSWLKGAVRVRRTDLTYIGIRDDDN